MKAPAAKAPRLEPEPLSSFDVGSTVWARGRASDPLWPARVVDAASAAVPENVRAAALKRALCVVYLGTATVDKARSWVPAARLTSRNERIDELTPPHCAPQTAARDYAWVREGQVFQFASHASLEARLFGRDERAFLASSHAPPEPNGAEAAAVVLPRRAA